jgi:hypothetical protein
MVGQTANNSSLIGQSGYDDDFEREDPTPNDINNSGISSTLGTPTVTNGGTIKQKEFIIKKMFKVPSNEQIQNGSGSETVAQAADLAKAVAPPSGSSGINIYNVNNPHVSGT